MTYTQHFKNTPQSQPVFGKDMVKNAAGGYVFEIDDWQRLRRFLLLGAIGGSYYESERKLTLENAECIRRCLAVDGARTVATIVEVSDGGLAIKNDHAIFALAAATKFGDAPTRKAAFAALPQVCRIGTHLFQFVEFREALGGGWGRGMREAIQKWYLRPDLNRPALVMQLLKYQQRNGWAQRDLLRLAHVKDPDRAAIFDAAGKPYPKHVKPETAGWADVPEAEGYFKLQATKDPKAAAALIAEYKLPREYVPTELLTEAVVWDALLPHMPLMALVRNLGNLSKCGLLKPLSAAATTVQAKLGDVEALRKSRLHPFTILLGSKTYASGHSVKGSGVWTAVPTVIEALDAAFYAAFKNVEPTNLRHLLAVDVSSSMRSHISGMPMSSAEAATAMALITAHTEPSYFIMGFATQFKDLGITSRDTLPTALQKTTGLNFGGTDTSIALKWALQNKIEMDVLCVYTDNETWAGDQHTFQALQLYRKTTGLPTKLAVIAFTATGRSIADKADAGSMDFVGCDASLPLALRAFVTE